jgi:hypothetical protein
MPEWIEDLQQAGFDVMTRDGQLFLQRGTVAPQQQQQQQQKRRSAPAPSSTRQQQQSVQASAAAGTPVVQPAFEVSDRNLQVHAEFDAAVWQQHIHRLQRSGSTDEETETAAAAAAAGAWYASSASTTAAGAASAAHEPASATSSSDESSSSRNITASGIQRTLLSFKHPDAVLALLQIVFPAWAANGCWLVSQTGLGVVAAPSPAESAAALKGLALAARRAGLNNVQLQSLVSTTALLVG